jgi:hypothetical protein
LKFYFNSFAFIKFFIHNTGKSIFAYAAETIPKLKSRGASAKSGASAAQSSADQSKSGKKSNKKK